jgi:hypothetical protein
MARAWNIRVGVMALGCLVDTTSIVVSSVGEYMVIDS